MLGEYHDVIKLLLCMTMGYMVVVAVDYKVIFKYPIACR